MPLAQQAQHLGQKYMGVRPQNHVDAMFKSLPVEATGNHPVPISNFMNAQCKFAMISLPAHARELGPGVPPTD